MRAAVDPHPRPSDHWDWLQSMDTKLYYECPRSLLMLEGGPHI